jgi:hypothetical protein
MLQTNTSTQRNKPNDSQICYAPNSIFSCNIFLYLSVKSCPPLVQSSQPLSMRSLSRDKSVQTPSLPCDAQGTSGFSRSKPVHRPCKHTHGCHPCLRGRTLCLPDYCGRCSIWHEQTMTAAKNSSTALQKIVILQQLYHQCNHFQLNRLAVSTTQARLSSRLN